MLRVTLFGRFNAVTEDSEMQLRDGSKAQELLAYLLLNPQRPHTREAIASLLWGECSTDASKAYLRKALWQLRSALENCDKGAATLLHLNSDWIEMHVGPQMSSDVAGFQGAYTLSCNAEAHALTTTAVSLIDEALELYGEGLMPNHYEPWCLEERSRLRQMYLSMREQMLEYYITQKRYTEAMEQGAKILVCDRAHERTHQRLMWLYEERRDRAAALAQYKACAQAMAEELGVKPSHETVQLYLRIRDGVTQTGTFGDSMAELAARSTVDSLREFQALLRSLESSVTSLTARAESLVSNLEARAAAVMPRNGAGYETGTTHDRADIIMIRGRGMEHQDDANGQERAG